ncbi:MAG TPA: hypothetical protein VGU20_01565 [Stellaceae bacterium]|nr:hypothetical protein [Stellaceae bacterium]
MPRRIGVITTIVIAALSALTGGCVSEAELRAQDEAQCASYGFERGTPAFAGCLQQETLARRYILNSYDAGYGPFGGPGLPFWYAPPVVVLRR